MYSGKVAYYDYPRKKNSMVKVVHVLINLFFGPKVVKMKQMSSEYNLYNWRDTQHALIHTSGFLWLKNKGVQTTLSQFLGTNFTELYE